jgi:hypothetical protein
MNHKSYQTLESIGTVMWLISDFIWMCGYNQLAAIIITPVIYLTAVACIQYTGKKQSELLSMTAGVFWVLMNACWIYSEIVEAEMYMICAKISFICAAFFVYLSFKAAKKESGPTDFTRLKIK